MKKIFIYVLAGMTLLPMATGCNSLDLESESTITGKVTLISVHLM